MVRDFGEFKSKGIAWCRFEDPFATSHILASNIKFGNQQATIVLWGTGENSGQEALKSLVNRTLVEKDQYATKKAMSSSDSSQASSESEENSEAESEEQKSREAEIEPEVASVKIIVGSRVVEIDSKEKCIAGINSVTNVVELASFIDPKELETSAYFDISSEVERQLMKFGQINSFKILRKSEGYQNPGKILIEYEKLEAAILAKFTINVDLLQSGPEVQRKTGNHKLL